MSLKNSNHLPIRWIAKRWAAEANRPDDVAEIENDLIDAALHGEFQFPARVDEIRRDDDTFPSNYDLRLRMSVETFDRNGKPRSAHHLQRYRLVRADREFVQEICISIEGLRRFAGQHEFNTWAKLRGLKRPTFAGTDSGREQRTVTISAETRCKDWLVALMKNGGPKKPKDNYRQDAKRDFGVGTKAFNRAWANAIVETGNIDWKKPGRKPKRKS